MRLHLFVSGKVQGVSFRRYSVEAAKENNVFGWVKNCSDGNVEIVAEGDPKDLIRFVAIIKVGPAGSEVKDIEMQEEKSTGEFTCFERKEIV